jgi:predicted permease
MKLDFMTVLINIAALLLLGAPGYVFRKLKFFGEKDAKPFVILLIYVTQSFMIIMSFQERSYSPDILGGMAAVFIFSLVMHIAVLFAAGFIFGKFKISEDKKGIYTFASAFSNCGYMGIPVINSLFRQSADKAEMLIYVAVYVMVFNIVNWTVGIYIISRNKKYISLKNAFINPTTISLAVALPLFFLNIKIADISPELNSSMKMLGEMTTPVAMIIIGIKLAEMPIGQVFNSPIVYFTSFIKLIVAPLFMYGMLFIFGFVGISQVAFIVLMIITAMPTATITVANAERFGGDSLCAAKTMLCSTLLSMFTIPLICLLL